MKFKESKTFKGSPKQYIRNPWNPTNEPKPTVMDKAEELRRLIINDLYLNMEEDMATDTLERIDEYAQHVSREVAIEFREWLHENHWANFSKGPKMEELFDKYWQQKQK